MIQIARSTRDGKPVNLNDIAGKTGVSRRYLEQVVIPLKNANLLKGMSGKDGGYFTAKSAEEIKVGDIVQAAIGPINIVNCVNDRESCMKVEWCECRPLYLLLNKKITDALNEFTLADLADHKVNILAEEPETVKPEKASAEKAKSTKTRRRG
jgi:Rrf2 family protein